MNNGKICVSVAAETADEMIERIKRAEPLADVIELRFDYLLPGQIENFRSQISNIKCNKPLIGTYRSREEGGKNAPTLGERIAFWQHPIAEIWAADVERDIVDKVRGWPFRIVSSHEWQGVEVDLGQTFEHLFQCDADVIKIAAMASDVTDAIGVWTLLGTGGSAGKQIIPIAMGEAGKWTRILGPAHGAYLTYASLDDGNETAEGQITAHDMIDVYRVKELDKETKVYGVIGDPVSESLSPHMHNAAFPPAGLNAVFVPLLVKNLDAFMTRMVLPATREVELNFAGFAVTMPHKQAVMRYLDRIDETAAAIGAVNTIKIENGKLTGHNTDADGFIEPLKARFGDLKDARVAILGAGGAARACVYGLKAQGAEVTIFARDKGKAEPLRAGLDITAADISDLRSGISNFDVFVNATPLGMKGEFEAVSPLTGDELKGVRLVFDLVTSAADTPLIRNARSAGVPTITGVEMLIEQGAKQFEIWTARHARIDVMRSAAAARMDTMR